MRSKMWAVGVSRTFLWLLLTVVGAALQLPPDIQADRYLVRAQRQIEEQDFAGAKQSMDQILALQSQHGLEIPEEFFYRYAEVLNRLELHDEAIEAATKYLTLAGRDGGHYREALEMLDEIEQAKAAAVAAAEADRRRAEAASKRAAATKAASEEARRSAEAVIDGMEFVWVPAGEFRMGSRSSEAFDNERPRTRVRISRGFWLGKYEVTEGQWEAVMGKDPSTSYGNPSVHYGCGPDCAVVGVSWDEVQEFIDRLNARSIGARYRLPTEAEWEYTARAGTSGDRYAQGLDAVAWNEDNQLGYGDNRQHSSGPHPVGRKAPNVWGLHDMLGNASEWVEDWYGRYPGGSVNDPRGPASGSNRVVRGCHWNSGARECRVSFRYYSAPDYGNLTNGFRLVKTE